MTGKVEDSWIILGLVVDLGFRGSLGKKGLAKAMAWPPINSSTPEVVPSADVCSLQTGLYGVPSYFIEQAVVQMEPEGKHSNY